MVSVSLPRDGLPAPFPPGTFSGVTHLIQAVGYVPVALPSLKIDGGYGAWTERFTPENLQSVDVGNYRMSPVLTLDKVLGEPGGITHTAAGPLLLFGTGVSFPENLNDHPK